MNKKDSFIDRKIFGFYEIRNYILGEFLGYGFYKSNII